MPATRAPALSVRIPARVAAALSAALIAASALAPRTQAQPTPPAPVPEIHPGILQGYLAPEALPDSLALLPPPPAEDSATFARDKAFSRRTLSLRGTPRWTQATEDADLSFPAAARTFSCALNAPITQQDTPHLYQMLRRSLTDAGFATYRAKDHYKRQRPFVLNNDPICTPAKETGLRTNGSYPSGHSSAGWAWALILAELAPDRETAVLIRGKQFGQSRVVCNVHWESDVLGGQTIGAATVARLHSDPVFQKDLAAAKQELAAVRARAMPPGQDCAVESAALALDPLQAP